MLYATKCQLCIRMIVIEQLIWQLIAERKTNTESQNHRLTNHDDREEQLSLEVIEVSEFDKFIESIKGIDTTL